MSQTDAETPKKKKSLFSLGGSSAIWLIAAVAAVFAMGGALTILGNSAATSTYYVLGRDVPARTQITTDMLIERVTKVDGAPPNAYDLVFVRDNDVFSKIALEGGDVITPTTVGPLERITKTVPGNFVAASVAIAPENAVAGKIRAGDHIDLVAINSDNPSGPIAKFVLHHALVLDVTVAPQSIAQTSVDGQEGEAVENPGPESEQVRSGIPAVYTLALSPEDAARVALVRTFDLMAVLSGSSPDQELLVTAQMNEIFADEPVGDSAAGTSGAIKPGQEGQNGTIAEDGTIQPETTPESTDPADETTTDDSPEAN